QGKSQFFCLALERFLGLDAFLFGAAARLNNYFRFLPRRWAHRFVRTFGRCRVPAFDNLCERCWSPYFHSSSCAMTGNASQCSTSPPAENATIASRCLLQ